MSLPRAFGVILYLNDTCAPQYMCFTSSYAVMVTALNKAGQAVGAAIWFSHSGAGEQVLMTHIHDRYIIRAILVQGFSSVQTACLHVHIVSAAGMTQADLSILKY